MPPPAVRDFNVDLSADGPPLPFQDSTEEAAGAVPAYESTTPCGDNGARTGQLVAHMDDLKAQEPTFLRIRLSLYHHPQLLALAEPRGCGWSDATTACKRSCCVACAGFEAFRPQEVCASLSVNDPRFVMIIVEDWVYEWELAAGTGRDIWTRGLDFIASKANGEIPASRFWVDDPHDSISGESDS